MGLRGYLHKESVCMDLQARDRDAAIQALLEALVAAEAMPGGLVLDAREAILEREKLGSTAIGRGVAVPHARVDGLDGVLVAFGRSQDGLAFHALDNAPVHLVFLVIAGRDYSNEYLEVMKRISGLVQNDDFRRFVSRARGADEVLDLVDEMDK